MTSFLIRDTEEEAEIGMIQPQAKEHQEPPEAGGGMEGSVSGAFVWALEHLDFRDLASRTVSFCS